MEFQNSTNVTDSAEEISLELSVTQTVLLDKLKEKSDPYLSKNKQTKNTSITRKATSAKDNG